MFAWFNKMGSEKKQKMFKICSESFGGLQIHHSFIYFLFQTEFEVHTVRKTSEVLGWGGYLVLTKLSALCYVYHLLYFT